MNSMEWTRKVMYIIERVLEFRLFIFIPACSCTSLLLIIVMPLTPYEHFDIIHNEIADLKNDVANNNEKLNQLNRLDALEKISADNSRKLDQLFLLFEKNQPINRNNTSPVASLNPHLPNSSAITNPVNNSAVDRMISINDVRDQSSFILGFLQDMIFGHLEKESLALRQKIDQAALNSSNFDIELLLLIALLIALLIESCEDQVPN